jgi:hypothetical protein
MQTLDLRLPTDRKLRKDLADMTHQAFVEAGGVEYGYQD